MKEFLLETIKIFGKIDIDKDYSEDDLNQVLKNSMKLIFLKNITLKINNQILIIDVD